MKKYYSLILIFINFFLLFSQKNISSQSDYYFYENKGQIIDQKGNANSKVKYLFNSGGLNVQIKKEGFSYDVYEVEKTKKKKSKVENSLTAFDRKPKDEFDYKFKFHRVDIDFLNANKNPEIIAEGKSTDYENYYNIPHKPEGVTEVHRYQKITYKNIYPNIDLVFFKPKDSAKTIEYNFIIHPKGKISDIKLKFKGAKTKLKDGKLSMNLRFGEMQENIPHSWMEEPSKKTDLSVQFREIENGVFGFAAPQDSFDKTVVIDPVPNRIWRVSNVNWTTHKIFSKIIEKDNYIYSLDLRMSFYNVATDDYIDFDYNGKMNYGYLAKFDTDGNKIFGIYIGNHHAKWDESNDVNDFKIDKDENIYIVGSARDDNNGNNNITTKGAYKEHSTVTSTSQNYNTDAFLIKFSSSGKKIWGTYFGGDNHDSAVCVEINSKNQLIISGFLGDTDYIKDEVINFPDTNGLTKKFFIAVFDENGNFITSKKMNYNNNYSNFYYSAIDKNDNLYIAATIYYDRYENLKGTVGTHQPNIIGDKNVFLTKYDKDLKYLWGTYFGGRSQIVNNNYYMLGNTSISGLVINSQKEIIFAGNTNSFEKISTTGVHQENLSGINAKDMYIAKFNENGNQIWGTYYGDNSRKNLSDDDNLYCLNIDEFDNIFIGGNTGSIKNISTIGSYLETNNSSSLQGFFSKFTNLGKQIWGTYYYNPIYSIFASKKSIYTNDSYYLAKFSDCQNNVFVSSNSPVCPNTDIKLTASGGTSYSWTGPNGFTSTDQNPIISNATSANSGIYSCTIFGTGDCDGTYTVEVKVEDKTAPIPDLANLPDITGDCNTVISMIPTATDNCSGKITATTIDSLQYSIPGTYTITWKYDDGNGNTFTQNQKVIITSPALPTAISPQTFCAIDAPKISNISITGQNIIWYDDSGNVLNTATPLIDGTTYYASQTINGCESDKILVQVKINTTSLPLANSNQSFCNLQNPKIANIIITGTNIKWYDASGNIINDQTPIFDNTDYYATQTINYCESDKVKIHVQLNYSSSPIANANQEFCLNANPKISDINISGQNIIWYNSSGNIIDQNTYLINGEKYFATQTINGCESDKIAINITLKKPQNPTVTSPQTFCAIDVPKISNISITGQNIIWYDDSGNVLNTATPLIDGTIYYASQTINGCESDKIAIQVKVNATPLPTGNTNQDFCTSRNAQIKDLAVTGTSLKFYDNLGNVLPNTIVLQNNTSYFVTQTLNNCESPKLEIKVTLTANSLPANDYTLAFCNDTTENSKTEDLRRYQENIITGSSAYSFEYFDQNNNSISDFANRNLIIGFNIFNVKVKSVDGCWKMVQLKLQLNPKPVVNLPVNAEFCRGLSVNLDAGSGFKSYVWTKEGTPTTISNAQILNVSEVGKYTVEVTNSSDCKNTSSTLVNQSILANILKVEITNNDAKVLLSANGDFVYSLDNKTWQNSSEFPNLNNGIYTVYVKTKLGCIIGEMNFTIFDIPNTFTPNSDGVNDTWKITGMENYPNSEITILDRFGTAVLKKIINGTFEWNGQINGRILPTGTYWYVLKVSDGRIFQGYVLIKNRN